VRLAVMQPYLFPYLGYHQLAYAADDFVFYDDVAFIKGGWMNRNFLLGDQQPQRFTLPLRGATPNAAVVDTATAHDAAWVAKFERTLTMSYTRAPFRDEVLELAVGVMRDGIGKSLADVAAASVRRVFDHLGLERRWYRSSVDFADTVGEGRATRLTTIAHRVGADVYVNAAGGADLYDKADFASREVALQFLHPRLSPYRQGGTREFVPSLSVLDVLMFNDRESVVAMLGEYELS